MSVEAHPVEVELPWPPDDIPTLIERARLGAPSILYGEDGEPVAAVFPFAGLFDAKRLADLIEDVECGAAAAAAEAESARSGIPPVPLEQLLEKHEL
ncbi:MAG: hypothetical protein HYU66_02645 [Armatimonadetes bacterium]|nr:hypothetical protein [Armatimonadota bacterium]